MFFASFRGKHLFSTEKHFFFRFGAAGSGSRLGKSALEICFFLVRPMVFNSFMKNNCILNVFCQFFNGFLQFFNVCFDDPFRYSNLAASTQKKILESTDWELLTFDRLSYAADLRRIDEVVEEVGGSAKKRIRFIFHDLKDVF